MENEALLQAISRMVDEKLAQQKQEILDGVQVRFETEVDKKFKLLAENQQLIIDKLTPNTRIDNIEDDVDLLKAVAKQHSADIQELKMAMA